MFKTDFLAEKEQFHKLCLKEFSKYDKDRSGELDLFEVQALLKNLFRELNCAPPKKEDILTFFDLIDLDKSGKISLTEFKVFMKIVFNFILKEIIQQLEKIVTNRILFNNKSSIIFQRVDTDSSGEIDKRELTRALHLISIEIGTEPPTREYAEQIFHFLDADNSGKLSKEEFKVFVKYIFEGTILKLKAIINDNYSYVKGMSFNEERNNVKQINSGNDNNTRNNKPVELSGAEATILGFLLLLFLLGTYLYSKLFTKS